MSRSTTPRDRSSDRLRDRLCDRSREIFPPFFDLATFGLVVHPPVEWPLVWASFHGPATLPPRTPLHTTQARVRRAAVLDKKRLLERGATLFVHVFQVDGSWWVFNGHHTLVALGLLGLGPVFARFDVARSPERGTKLLEPPKLV